MNEILTKKEFDNYFDKDNLPEDLRLSMWIAYSGSPNLRYAVERLMRLRNNLANEIDQEIIQCVIIICFQMVLEC